MPFTVNLTTSNAGTGNSRVYSYSSTAFYPVDGRGFGNYYLYSGTAHNYNFAFAYHGVFTYQGDESFSFTGDDDLYVYVNDRIAMNLGGVHSAESGSFNITWPTNGCPLASYPNVACYTKAGGISSYPCACLLGLSAPTNGNSYNIDIFYNERHTTASDLTFSTSLYIYCAWYDWCGVCQGNGQTCW